MPFAFGLLPHPSHLATVFPLPSVHDQWSGSSRRDACSIMTAPDSTSHNRGRCSALLSSALFPVFLLFCRLAVQVRRSLPAAVAGRVHRHARVVAAARGVRGVVFVRSVEKVRGSEGCSVSVEFLVCCSRCQCLLSGVGVALLLRNWIGVKWIEHALCA